MRRMSWVLAMILCVTVVFAGCGKKDAASVVKGLNHVADTLQSKEGSYKGAGKMTLYTGEKPQEYNIEVWYQNPNYYRISLTNAQKDVTQIVLRNDDGVFVLTPSLNKSFRFKSDWPENQGQVYLYQTLVQGILNDNSRQFAIDKDSYVFDVAANYHSQSLVRQKIWLSKENYAPKQVQVSDAEAHVMVEVKFSDFKFDAKFEKDSFDMKRNMTASDDPTLGMVSQVDENGNPISADDQHADGSTAAASQELGDFGTIIPVYVPEGVENKDVNKMEESSNHTVILRYDGTYQYTIMESRSQDKSVSSLASGTVIDLGFTSGLLIGDEPKTLTWMNDEGIEFRITSSNLPVEEMTKIAVSLQEQTGK
ncbi:MULTISPECIES: DUF4367 domain-containing protein [Paenibacillus]|uniref:Sporulation protein YdcC n=1 Tax=Paenibacillus azoreducens TaxID=116718 RepID=A0A919YD25_9BACL|nr:MULTISPECIES: DUF4367 domain-containing protein [Paenibacillus]MBE9917218.1 DUF4367 domain-containing protein [Paenibacillus donghaensis]GIO48209.1 sporulation protein YdcC [Paenibacillus azoreducens]